MQAELSTQILEETYGIEAEQYEEEDILEIIELFTIILEEGRADD